MATAEQAVETPADGTPADGTPADGTPAGGAHTAGRPTPRDGAATSDAPWDRSCRAFAALLGDALAELGCRTPVTVAPLGVSDVFADSRPAAFPAVASGEPGEVGAGPPVPVHLYGRHAVVGPLPGGPACPQCFARRWQAVRSISLREALETGGDTGATGESPYVTRYGAAALGALIAGLTPGEGRAVGPDRPYAQVHLLDLESLTVRRHSLVPDPECPGCARPEKDDADAAAFTLAPAPKHSPGSFRVRGIDAYALPVEPYANPVCGSLGPSIVHDVSSTSTSATIGCFSMRSGDYLRETFWGGHADTFGHSMRIGVLEGLERYAGMRARARTASVRDSLEGLRARGVPVVDPRVCGLYSDDFHRANPHIAPFTPDREVTWVWGWSLRDERPLLVPEVLTYYHVPGQENRFVQESSNGCASGGALEEAVYFGLMEVIERDAFLLTWYGRAALPEIDPATSTRAATRHMVDRLEMYGYEARFFDTRLTFPVPVVTAVAERHDGGLGRMCFGAGAGLDPESALAAALCEIATDAVNLQGRTEREEARLRAMADDFHRVAALHDHPLAYGVPEMGRHAEFLLGSPGEPRPPRRAMHDLYGDGSVPAPSADLREDLRTCVDAVTAEGFDVVVVDQTMPEQRRLGLTTVSVLVPGLLPIDFGWTRQRARHMPRMRTALRAAGLRAHDLDTDDLNPAPHPFP